MSAKDSARKEGEASTAADAESDSKRKRRHKKKENAEGTDTESKDHHHKKRHHHRKKDEDKEVKGTPNVESDAADSKEAPNTGSTGETERESASRNEQKKEGDTGLEVRPASENGPEEAASKEETGEKEKKAERVEVSGPVSYEKPEIEEGDEAEAVEKDQDAAESAVDEKKGSEDVKQDGGAGEEASPEKKRRRRSKKKSEEAQDESDRDKEAVESAGEMKSDDAQEAADKAEESPERRRRHKSRKNDKVDGTIELDSSQVESPDAGEKKRHHKSRKNDKGDGTGEPDSSQAESPDAGEKKRHRKSRKKSEGTKEVAPKAEESAASQEEPNVPSDKKESNDEQAEESPSGRRSRRRRSAKEVPSDNNSPDPKQDDSPSPQRSRRKKHETPPDEAQGDETPKKRRHRRHHHDASETATDGLETPERAGVRRLPQSLPQSRAPELEGSLEIPESHFTESQLERALQRQMKGAALPPDNMKLAVIQYAQDKSYQMLMQENYDEASRIDQAIDVIRASVENDITTERQETQRSCVAARLDTANRREQDIVEHWNRQIAEYREQCNVRMQEIQSRHEEEKRQFQEEWARPEALVPYSKPSSELLQLKRQQQILAMNQDYRGAKHLKEQVDRLQEQESQASGKRASEAMKSQYLQLMDRQKREISCFIDYSKQHIEVMEKERNQELRKNENVRKRLQGILSTNSPVNRRANVVVPRLQGQSQLLSPVAMQRRRQMNTMRMSPEKPRLNVHLTDLNKLVKPSASPKFQPIKF